VTDVNDPLLSVADTLDHIGGEVVFTRFGGHVKGENGKKLKLVRDGKAYYIDGARAEPVPVHAVGDETTEADDMDMDPMMPKDQAEQFPHLTGGSSSSQGPAGTAAAGASASSASAEAVKIVPERPLEAKRRRAPHEPTPEEKERHVWTHIPYRDWCEECICAKARDNPHRRARTATDIDRVELDYLFLTSNKHEGEKITVLVATWCDVGAIAATVAVKGATPFLTRYVVGVLEMWGVGDAVIRTDQEQAIMAQMRAMQDERKQRTVLTNAPRYAHAAMGAVERANQTMAGEVRVLRLSLQKHLGQRLPASHPLMAWVIRHAAWLLTRFTIRSSGHTPYETIRGQAYRSELVELGEPVYARRPADKEAADKLDARWESGFWVGKTETTEEHLVSTKEAGIVRMRTIRRRVLSERWSAMELAQLRGAPWDLRLKASTEDSDLYAQERHASQSRTSHHPSS
jgi:hypothetical protein